MDVYQVISENVFRPILTLNEHTQNGKKEQNEKKKNINEIFSIHSIILINNLQIHIISIKVLLSKVEEIKSPFFQEIYRCRLSRRIAFYFSI